MTARPRLFLWLIILTVSTVLYAGAAPVAGFSIIMPVSNCNPTIYSFVSSSTGSGLSYRWNFGVYPGTNSIFPNPSTTYLNCGTYPVKLVVTDSLGQSDSVVQTVNIRCSPTAQFTTPSLAGCIPLSTSFNSTSLPGTGTITSYVWDFGDGNGGSGPSPVHTYTGAGCKNVTLIVTNSFNCTSDTTMNNLLCAYQLPVNSFTSSAATSCNAPFTVNYTASAASGLAPYSHQWLFPGGVPATSNLPNPTVVYNNSGQFNATLITTDAHGCADTLQKLNYVSIAGNNLDFTLGNSLRCAPAQIPASGISSPAPLNWLWTVTQPATMNGSTTQTPNFAFPDSGVYTICLSVNYAGGCAAQKCTTVVIKSSPTAYFTTTGALNTCLLPHPITFTDSSSGNGLTYIWNFQGGVPASSTSATPPAVVYDTCGTYFAGLTVTDLNGCKSTHTKPGYLQIVCNPATYTVSPSIGCIPLTSQFNSTASAGNPVAWLWDFDDPSSGPDNSSTLQNPSHTFLSDGCYNVKLTTTNALGCQSFYELPAGVCCGWQPHANFSANPPMNCVNEPFYFTDSSTGTYQYTSYVWGFHDVPPYIIEDTVQNPVYTYYDVGTYAITLIVSNYGCADTITKDDLVQTVYPLAVPQVIRNCDNPLTVTLDGSGSLGAQTLKWLIPGGSPDSSTSAIVTATYPGPGDYAAYLYVTNDTTGCSDLESVVVQISGVGAQFSATPLFGCAPLQSCFSSTTNNVTQYQWKATNSFGVVDTTASSEAPCFTFKNAGIYSVQLIVSDTFGCIDTVFKPDYVYVSKPTAKFTASPVSGCVPLVVNFNDSSNVPFRGVEKWNWNFGDLNSGAADSSALQNPEHIYNDQGTYSVNLTIADSNGCVSDTLRVAYIHAHQPTVSFTETNTPQCNGLQSCFVTTASEAVLQYHWDFGDGQTADTSNPCHLFTATGPFLITLVVIDSSQCTDTASTINGTTVVFPNPAFIASDTFSSCPPLSVSFTNLSANFDSATSWRWEFGDGQVSSLKNPFHIYTVGGIFSVTLIASNPGGCNDTLVYTDYIKITGPSAYTATAPTSGCVPHYTCMSAVSAGTNTYTWNFGDGTVLPGADSVCYTYIRTGTFYPELILNDGFGCVFSLPLGRVDVTGTVSKFKVDTNFVCQQGTIHFVDSSFGSSTAQAWNWNFGDPNSGAQNTSSLQNPSHFYSAPGIYRVVQRIQSTDGCTDSTSQYITIAPAPSVTINLGNTSACAPDSVQLQAQINSTAAISSIRWNFGDTANASNTSALSNPVHYYAHPGSYSITVTITDTNGCVGAANAPLQLRQRPLASYSAFDKCIDKQPFVFINNSQFANSYSWSFGDGTNSTIFNPTKTYTDTGAYAVQLIAANSFCSDTLTKTLQVFSIPDAVFAVSANGLCGPAAQFALTNLSTNANTYVWNLGNNITTGLTNPIADFTAPGNYTILLTAITVNGCKDTTAKTVTVYPKPDIRTVTISPADGCAPLAVSFSAYATNASVYQWNFGADTANATSTTGQASYTYRDTGTFTVSLSVSSIHQCTDSVQLIDTVKVHIIPVANFDTLISSSVYPYDGSVAFINQSTNADNYYWDFGDGQTTTDENPSHVYEKIDAYTVLLVSSTRFGCADSAAISVNIIKKALDVPNALQPDFKGAEELVKVWKPLGIGLLNYRAQVFDKWGALLWESELLSETIPVEAWDGTYLGKPCQQEVYVWKISAVFLDGTVWKGINYDKDVGGGTKTVGSITLVR